MGLLRELGFNRISLGVQDLDPAVQRAVNRLQSLGETRTLVEAARTLQFRSVNIDLIYGIEQVTQNIGEVHAEGIDYSVRYKWDLGQWGGLEAALDGTYVMDASYMPSPGAARVDCVGHYGKQCGLPSTVSQKGSSSP